jgi:rod shape determining protein RodA
MSGYILFVGFCAVLFFVVGVKYGDVMWGEMPAGDFIVLILIIISVIFLLNNYKKGRHFVKYFIIGSIASMTISFVLSFFIEINFYWVALGIIALMILFLFFTFVKYRIPNYLYIALFAIFSTTYSYSISYVFDKVLEPHQKVRMEVSLGMIDDPSGAGYNVNQSQIAIGSGGLLGKGYLNGTQTKLKYVPEQDTDFIFCTVGEEKGFLGTTLTLSLFIFLIIRLIFLAERQRTTFSRVYGYSVASILFFHVAINVGMVIGLTPVIGIPLPFFSYGGSSLWAFTTLLFIFLRLDASRNDRL